MFVTKQTVSLKKKKTFTETNRKLRYGEFEWGGNGMDGWMDGELEWMEDRWGVWMGRTNGWTGGGMRWTSVDE